MTDTAQPGFVAVYRWRVAPDNETAFIEAWTKTTEALIERGGQGSLLGRSEDGAMCAIALWPSRDARDQAFADESVDIAWPEVERHEPILIDPISNLWVTPVA